MIRTGAMAVFFVMGTSPALAYKTSISAIHFGTSIGGAYAAQIGSNATGWDLVSALTASGDNYQNPNSYKTPIKLGFFYRHPSFTFDTYLRYFTGYHQDWSLGGSSAGAGTSRYAGIGIGLDVEMPMMATDNLRFGLMLNAEYLKNRLHVDYAPTVGAKQKLSASSTNPLVGAGFFAETYVGDLWSLGLHGIYAHDLGSPWKSATATTFLGKAYTAGGDILDTNAKPIGANFSHWRLELGLRLAFY